MLSYLPLISLELLYRTGCPVDVYLLPLALQEKRRQEDLIEHFTELFKDASTDLCRASSSSYSDLRETIGDRIEREPDSVIQFQLLHTLSDLVDMTTLYMDTESERLADEILSDYYQELDPKMMTDLVEDGGEVFPQYVQRHAAYREYMTRGL